MQLVQTVRIRRMSFNKNQIAVANATSSNGGIVGRSAVVPRIVAERCSKSESILDFGAGKIAQHTKRLRKEGFNVTAYDFGGNVVDGLHDPKALERKYDVVFASNVLNVQSSPAMMYTTLTQIMSVVKRGGRIYANYPKDPRKCRMLPLSVRIALENGFGIGNVTLLEGSESPKGSPVWEIKR